MARRVYIYLRLYFVKDTAMKKLIISIIIAYILALLNFKKVSYAGLVNVIVFYIVARYIFKKISVVFFYESIEWPASLARIKRLYYALLKLMKQIFSVCTFYLLAIMLADMYYDQPLKIEGINALLLIFGVFFLLVCYLTFSECWCLHDRWAESNNSVSISKLMDGRVKAGKRPTCYDWLIWDALMFFVVCSGLQGEPSTDATLVSLLLPVGVAVLWGSTVLLHAYLWYKYKNV